MSVDESLAVPTIVHVDRPACFWLDGERVLFELSTGKNVFCGDMSAADFIDSFRRAADVVHLWTSEHYSGGGLRVRSGASTRKSGSDRSKATPEVPA